MFSGEGRAKAAPRSTGRVERKRMMMRIVLLMIFLSRQRLVYISLLTLLAGSAPDGPDVCSNNIFGPFLQTEARARHGNNRLGLC